MGKGGDTTGSKKLSELFDALRPKAGSSEQPPVREPPDLPPSPPPQELARFTVCITGTDDGTWQGTVEGEGECFRFQSEMQLLRWLWKRCPALLPDTSHPGPGGPENEPFRS